MELFKNQNYSKLQKHHRKLGVPWTDPTFAPSDTSIGHSKSKQLPRNLQWKRPHEFCQNPRLAVDGISTTDATQGRLGNCWFVAACSVLAGCKTAWQKVVPDYEQQEWPEEMGSDSGYTGIFRFRFWRFGSWVEVLVDDLLPVTQDNDLLFTHSSSNREFWPALVEKAYAKLHGCYAVLDGGNLSDALVDFTSGVSEVVDLSQERASLRSDLAKKKALFKTMETEIADHALMCCAIQANTAEEVEQRTDLGLVKGHAYGITAVKKVPIGGTNLKTLFTGREKLYLVRLQNPWGKKEWTGPFSDTSPEWFSITDKEREKLGLTFQEDGQFWMPFDDFLAHFTEMSICRLINTSLFSFSKTWTEQQFFGSWTVGAGHADRAGGCLNHRETFLNNPQYRFDVVRGASEPSPDDKDPDKGIEVIIQLSQKDNRVMMDSPKENLVIGFHIMKCELNRKYRLHALIPNSSVVTSDYIKTKHIFLRTFIKVPGRYMIIPTTFVPAESTDYLLRVFYDNSEVRNVAELKNDFPESSCWKSCVSAPVLATRVKVINATGLENQDSFGKSDPYCVVKCEGATVKGPVDSDTLNPTWKDMSLLFYRKDASKPIKVQIWNHNLVVDSFMGQTLILAPPSGSEGLLKEELTLFGRGKKRSETRPGKILLEYETFDDFFKI